MEEHIRENLISPNVWTRLLYMILFGIIYSIAEILVVCTVIFQFFSVLITGRANEPVLKFGNNLSRYVYQVFRFETFNSEEKPFPFSDWPEEGVSDNVWLRDPEPPTPAEPEPAPNPQASDSAVSAPEAPPAQDVSTTDPNGDQNRTG